jgi:protein O-mannosyl-transferase
MAKQKSNSPKTALQSVPKGTPQYKTEKIEKSATSSIFDGYLPILAVLFLTVIAFSPTFQSDFVNWDDDLNITKNKYLNGFTFANITQIFSTTVIGGYNPLSIFTFAVERAIFGENNLSFVIHTDNLLLHLVNVYLVWRIVGAMGFNKWSAFGVALLFGIHPMRVESVAWATERKDVLFGAFYFAALLQYIKYLKSETYGIVNRHFLMAFGLFVLALFSKVQAVSLPLSMLALDYYFNRPLNFKLIFEKIHFFLGSLVYGSLTIFLLKNAKTMVEDEKLYTGFERIIIGFHTYAVYVGKFIFPWIMSPLYPYPSIILPEFYISALLLVVSIIGIVWAYRRGMTMLVFGWVFFFVNFIFVAQIVGAGQGFLADRFTYVPYFGFFLLLAAYTEGSLFEIKNYKLKINGEALSVDNQQLNANNSANSPSSIAKIAFVVYAVICLFLTFQQTKVWNNGENLWTKAIEFDDRSATAWMNRALYYRENKKDNQKALADLDNAIARNPKSAASYNSRGKTYTDMGNPTQAIADFDIAVKEKPTLAEAWANRGNANGQLGKIDAALADITEALRLDSTLTSAYLGRGNVYGILGRFEESVKDLTKALELDPKNADALLNRSITFHDMKQTEKALADNEAYLLLKTDNPTMWLNRGLLKSELGKHAEALPDFDTAIKLNGLEGGFYLERARCYLKLGNISAMRADVQAARTRGMQNFEAALLQ